MRLTKLALCASFIGSLVIYSSAARAQGAPTTVPTTVTGFAIDRFDPAPRGSDWFVADSLDLRGHPRPALGIVGSWAYKPLLLFNPNGSERAAIIEHQVVLHAGASLVLWNRLRLHANLPIAVYQTGDSPSTSDNARRFPSPSGQLGDVRLGADVGLVGEYGDPFRLAIGAAVYLPTGTREDYTSDGNVRVTPAATVAGDAGIFSYGAKLGFAYRPLTEAFDTLPRGSEMVFSAAAGLRFVDKKLLVGPEVYGATGTSSSNAFFGTASTPVEGLLGGHYTTGDVRFGVGVGTGLGRGWGTPDVRTVAMLEWIPSVDKDSDGDHIVDSEDACPFAPGVRTNDRRTNGCPPPAPVAKSDRDGDTITDDVDACPDVPGTASTDPARNGCPSDKDGDGVLDAVDACPDVAGVKTSDPKTNGCPPDKDGDGVEDSVDACPEVPGVKTDNPKTNGCPSDKDNDGVIDNVDACPNDPGPADPDPKKNGCPLARVEAGQVKIAEQVKFKTNSAEILGESDQVLTAVAKILQEHPEMKVRVEGHTDNRGAPAYNKDLSEKRAAAVASWLTKKGIDKKRLTSKGFGLEQPIDTNETEQGRQNNRRVEFHIEGASESPEKPEKK